MVVTSMATATATVATMLFSTGSVEETFQLCICNLKKKRQYDQIHTAAAVMVAGEGHKPGSVPCAVTRKQGDDHSSRVAVADNLKRPTRELRADHPQTFPY